MKPERKTLQELLAAYSLGILTPAERMQLERYLRSAGENERRLLADYRRVSAMLGLAIDPQAPSPEVKAQLLARIAAPEKAPALPRLWSLGRDAGEWREIFPGVTMKLLYNDSQRASQTVLVRMAPGSRLPRHRHLGREEVYMIEGEGMMAEVRYRAGDYLHADAGSIHETAVSEYGCLMLVLLPPVEFLNP